MRLIDIENIDYVRLEDSLHCLEHYKGDEVECVICAPTVEAIPKEQYEARLKADMVAILVELQLKIEENGIVDFEETYVDDGECIISVSECNRLIQQKINSLKGDQEGKNE